MVVYKRVLALQLAALEVGTTCECMGVAVDVDPAPAFVRIGVDDGTGIVHCILWPKEDGLPLFDKEGSLIAVRLGDLIRAQGKLGEWEGRRELSLHTFQVESDPNAETLHWLDVIAHDRLVQQQQQHRHQRLQPKRQRY